MNDLNIRFWIAVAVLLMIIGFTTASAQPAKGQLPPDPSVVTGKLKNGLTYFIQKNTESKDRVVMNLAVKAGSMQEEDYQQGLAHFLEHMAFNGTKNFPGNELLDYLQKQGVKFGADINAYTGFEETVYMLPIPTDNPEVVQQGLRILRDWAGDILMEQGELDAERGVILAEKRQRGGVQQRIQDESLPVILNNSRYTDRMPIGTEEVLNSFKRADIQQFYQDWYRPDLQGVIIVGDIDVTEMEKQVKRLFGDLKKPKNPKTREEYAVPLHGENQFLTVTDPEVTQATIQMLHKRAEVPFRYIEADMRAAMVRGLASSLIAGRLSEASSKPNPPFQAVTARPGQAMGGMEMFTLAVQPHRDRLEEGFTAAMAEVEGIRRHGFTQGELDRAKTRQLSAIEGYLNELDKRKSEDLAKALRTSFLKGQPPAPAPEVTTALQRRLLPGITLEEVNAQIAVLLQDSNRDIIVTAPEAELASLPDEAAVENWLAAVRTMDIPPYEDIDATGSLLAAVPPTGRIIAERVIPGTGATEWTLSNGARVVIKPTDYKNDEILIHAGSEGGTSLYGDADYESAANAAGLVPGFGIGDFDNIQLPKMLAGKRIGFKSAIGERSEGISGQSAPGDLGTALELLHLYFTAPRKDTALFSTTMHRAEQALANRYADPKNVLQDTLAALMGGYHPRRQPYTAERLDRIDLDRAVDIYRERFADAGDFTFYFVGNVDADTLRPLVERYIASLPAKGVKEEARDLGIRIPKGQIEKTIHAGKDDKATVVLYLHGDRDTTEGVGLALTALGEIVNYRLLERLREKEGGVYSPGIKMSVTHKPEPGYLLNIRFECAPGDVDKLVAATHGEIARLRTDGILADDLAKFKAEYLRQMEVGTKSNNFWLSFLTRIDEGISDPDDLEQLPERVEKLNAAELKQAASRYLHGEDVVKVVMMPVNDNNGTE